MNNLLDLFLLLEIGGKKQLPLLVAGVNLQPEWQGDIEIPQDHQILILQNRSASFVYTR